MDINICHLYYDIMNLYGENGNFVVLSKALSDGGFNVIEHRITIAEIPGTFNDFDLIYMGGGTESAQKMVLSDLMPHKEALAEFLINPSKLALFTGNSFEILGASVTTGKGILTKALGIFDFTTVESEVSRFTKDALFDYCERFDNCSDKIVGYINKASETFGIKTPLFKVLLGTGNSKNDKFEGLCTQGCFCTHLIGPILARNPAFLNLVIQSISDKMDFTPQPIATNTNQAKAYSVVLNELTKLL